MNLHGPVRAADAAGSGTAQVTISFAAWKDGAVVPTTHSVEVAKPKAAAKPEPVSPRLVATLPHPDRKASLRTVRFSPNGARLFTAGYPSGMVQMWDVASRKEVRRVDTPPGLRGSADYAVPSPDWKTLYVPVEGDKFVRGEKDGKKVGWREYNGAVRVWDLESGKEQPPLATPGRGVYQAILSPDGKTMVTPMARTGSADAPHVRTTEVWDLPARTSRPLCDGYGQAVFAPDGKTLAVLTSDHEAKTTRLRVLDAAILEERARADHKAADGRVLSLPAYTPDGRRVVAQLGGKKGAPAALVVFDAGTLAKAGELVGEADPAGYGWFGAPVFSPDGRRMAAVAGPGRVTVYDLAALAAVRTWAVGPGVLLHGPAFTPDGKRLLVGGQPKWDEAELGDEPDPADLPQPRVYVFDLGSGADKPADVLVAPPGYLGAVAVSPDGKTAALGTAGGVHLLDLAR